MEVRYNRKLFRIEGFVDGQWKAVTIGSDTTELNLPQKIDRYRIEVSLACNLSCEYCVVHKNDVSQQNKMMNLETAKVIVSKFNEEIGEGGSLFLMGGEPLTNVDVVKYLISESKGSSIIFTNSLALTDELIEFFYTNNVYILTSLDGHDLSHNKKRFYPNVELNFNRVVGNIKKAIDRGCKVGVSCLVHKDNIEDVEKIATYFVEGLGAKSMSFAYPHMTIKHTEESDFDFDKYSEQMIKLFEFAKNRKVYIDQIGKIIAPIYYSSPAVIGCKAGTTQRTFYPNGQETVCTKIDTLNSFDIRQYCDDLPFNNHNCENCLAKYICCGECPWDYAVAQLNGLQHSRICECRKKIITYIIDDMCRELSIANTIDEAKHMFKKIYGPLINNYEEE